MSMEPDDETLVREFLEGDGKAFGVLLARHERTVFNVALRMVGNRDDARDVTQSVFLKVYQNLGRFDPRFQFRTWIGRIAINESFNVVNHRKDGEPIDEHWPSTDRDPGEVARSGDVSRAVGQALGSLKPDYRAVVILRHYLDCSYRDMASMLEIPEKTVKSRLFTARQLLRDALAGRGVLES